MSSPPTATTARRTSTTAFTMSPNPCAAISVSSDRTLAESKRTKFGGMAIVKDSASLTVGTPPTAGPRRRQRSGTLLGPHGGATFAPPHSILPSLYRCVTCEAIMNARRLACGLAAHIAVAHGRSGQRERHPPAAARRGVSRQPVSNQVTGRPAFTHDPAIADPVFRQRRHRAGGSSATAFSCCAPPANLTLSPTGSARTVRSSTSPGWPTPQARCSPSMGNLAIHGCFWNRIRHSGEQVSRRKRCPALVRHRLGHRTRRRLGSAPNFYPTARAGSSTTRRYGPRRCRPPWRTRQHRMHPCGCRSF